MDNLVWGIPFLLVLLLCPLMMVGMGLFVWLAARLGFRRTGHGAAGGAGHSDHTMCGPMGMGHGDQGGRQPSSQDEVSTLRERVESLERQLSEQRPIGSSH